MLSIVDKVNYKYEVFCFFIQIENNGISQEKIECLYKGV